MPILIFKIYSKYFKYLITGWVVTKDDVDVIQRSCTGMLTVLMSDIDTDMR